MPRTQKWHVVAHAIMKIRLVKFSCFVKISPHKNIPLYGIVRNRKQVLPSLVDKGDASLLRAGYV